MVSKKSVIILTGPSAAGKTSLSIELAKCAGNVEIVNADSLLVYRGMDIGTAKPTPEERQGVPHHLIDIREPDSPYTAADFRKDALDAIEAIESRGNRPLIVGGTGFYVKALLFGIWDAPAGDLGLRASLESLGNAQLLEELEARDPESARRIGGNDRYRLIRSVEIIRLSGRTPSEIQAEQPRSPDPRFRLWLIDRDPASLATRIVERTSAMLAAGLVDEVDRLRKSHPLCRALGAVGYAQVVQWLEGRDPRGRPPASGLPGLAREIELATRQLVKRQRTFFRGLKLDPSCARAFELERDRVRAREEFMRAYG
jgi:tRNA dimethylallyltransferase